MSIWYYLKRVPHGQWCIDHLAGNLDFLTHGTCGPRLGVGRHAKGEGDEPAEAVLSGVLPQDAEGCRGKGSSKEFLYILNFREQHVNDMQIPCQQHFFSGPITQVC